MPAYYIFDRNEREEEYAFHHLILPAALKVEISPILQVRILSLERIREIPYILSAGPAREGGSWRAMPSVSLLPSARQASA